ncbi:MAG: PEP/pyruvate-binding domain-containing protein, partial [bacterium]
VPMEPVVLGFDELRQEDAERVGKKCANLGELTFAGFRVPPGYAVSLEGYSRFMSETGVRANIEGYLSSFSADPSKPGDMPRYDEASVAIRAMVEATPLPADIEKEVVERYMTLCEATGVTDLPVAVRSAGPASHPGQYESYLHIRGDSEVVSAVRRVWSSTFNQRSLIARARQGLDVAYDPIGVAVLQMVDAKAAGVMFTANPADGDTSKILIEANWGLGESVVAGEVTPDSFLIDKASAEIVKRSIATKKTWFTLDPATGRPSFQQVPEDKKDAPTLADEEAREIARVGVRIEEHFGATQDVEWAVDSGSSLPDSVMILQTRPAKHVAEKKNPTDRIIDFMLRGL